MLLHTIHRSMLSDLLGSRISIRYEFHDRPPQTVTVYRVTEDDGRLLAAIAARVSINEAEIEKLRPKAHSIDSVTMALGMMKERVDLMRVELAAVVEDVETLMVASREEKGARSVWALVAEKLWPIVPALLVWLWGRGHP